MQGVQTGFRDRVQYTLYHEKLGTKVITEPIGWEDDDAEYLRHSRYEGILTKLSNSSKYVEDGAKFINEVLSLYGINAEIILKKEIRHPHTDHWILDYTGVIDLSKWEEDGFEVKAKFNSSGLETILKSRESQVVEIERTTTIEGKQIPELTTTTIELPGKEVFLESTFSEDSSMYVRTDVPGGNGKYYQIKNVMPIKIKSKSDELIHNPLAGQFEWNPNSSHIFYGINDRKKTLKIRIKGQIRINNLRRNRVMDRVHLDFAFSILNGHGSYNFKESHLVYRDPNPNSQASRIAKFDKTFVVELEEGESLGFFVHTGALLGSKWRGIGFFVHEYVNPQIEISIHEDSSFEKTATKVVLAHDYIDRLLHIVTGRKNILHSPYLGLKEHGYEEDGKGALRGYACGHWLRGFDKYPISEDNKYKPFKTTLKDIFDDLMATENLGIGIEKVGYTEKVVIKPKEDFYVNYVTVRLPNQVKVKSKISEKKYYSSILIGAAKGWENEEAMGLDEYNTQSNFVTPITRVKNQYKRITKYIYGPYAGEFIRRKQLSKHPNLDHKNDQEVFVFALKREGRNYSLRYWQDDLENEPKGVYSPETSYNLLYSPSNLLFKHSKFIAPSLVNNRDSVIRFGSSKGNSNLRTKQKGKRTVIENNDIPCSELGFPLYVPKELELEHELSQELKEKLNGTTIINGKEVKNIYGLFEFVNQKGDIERGFFLSLKPKGKGKWKFLKAFNYDVFRN